MCSLDTWGQAQLKVCSLDVVPIYLGSGSAEGVFTRCSSYQYSKGITYLGSGSAEGVFTRCSSYLPGVRLSWRCVHSMQFLFTWGQAQLEVCSLDLLVLVGCSLVIHSWLVIPFTTKNVKGHHFHGLASRKQIRRCTRYSSCQKNNISQALRLE